MSAPCRSTNHELKCRILGLNLWTTLSQMFFSVFSAVMISSFCCFYFVSFCLCCLSFTGYLAKLPKVFSAFCQTPWMFICLYTSVLREMIPWCAIAFQKLLRMRRKKVVAVAAGVAWLEAEAGLTAAQRTRCHRAERLAPLGRKNYVASGRGRGDRFMFSPWEPLWELGKYGNLLSNPAPFRQTFSSFIELSIQKEITKTEKLD